ncbi:zinc finger BED domain-containing protein RICESLEEPER 2-like [Abrus precatorius]|uniref:B-like cyclin n=1 Tax=Abrus precatorius TaxID=3816 RepID=A0A8B8M8D8_ABRPR|nr:zinc finger BED domain-containing protein RICESLEEPER 2-like [Abrus precatorius]
MDKKLFSITLDNASANDSMQDILKAHFRLQNSLLCDDEYFHVLCSAHILNLIVQEGLKVVGEALYKIRESVKYAKGSDGRMIKFKDCVQEVGINKSIGLRLDVPTRWNSTYLMLESGIKYAKAFDILRVTDTNYKYCPSEEEWKRGEKMYEFLEPFYEITNMISRSSYPTSNLYFLQVWKIECMLDENLVNDDEVIKEMSVKMKTILTNIGKNKVKSVKEKFDKLYEEYMSDHFNTPNASQSQPFAEFSTLDKASEEGSRHKRSKVFKEFKRFQSETKSNIGKSELDLYLEDKSLDYDDNEDLDVLNYWKYNEKRFLTLKQRAWTMQLLAIACLSLAAKIEETEVPLCLDL